MSGANQYKAMQVKTASRGQILIMLYEAAIQNCRKAVDSIKQNDVPGKCKYIGKTHDIILELQSSLNFEIGGQIAEDLENLYNFMGKQLLKANAENSIDALQSTQKILENLLQGWKVAVQEAQKVAQAQQ